MLKSGIIEPSNSLYAAPVVLVKKNCSIRFCVDYRSLNQTDASQFGLGAVLEQEFEDGRHPEIFISKKLSRAECNYAVIEKECYAIVWAVKTLRVYLEGSEFSIFSNHAPLQWLYRMKTSNPRLLR